MKITSDQAKQQLDQIIDRAAAGEEVVIVRDGRPVARMVAVSPPHASGANGQGSAQPKTAPQRLGWGKDIITYIAPDFDEPLEDFREYME